MKLNGKKVEEVCQFSGYDIIYKNGFAALNESYIGIVELNMKVQNPKDNQFIGTNAFKISIYDSESMDYGID